VAIDTTEIANLPVTLDVAHRIGMGG